MLHSPGPVLHSPGPVLHSLGPVLHSPGPVLHSLGPVLQVLGNGRCQQSIVDSGHVLGALAVVLPVDVRVPDLVGPAPHQCYFRKHGTLYLENSFGLVVQVYYTVHIAPDSLCALSEKASSIHYGQRKCGTNAPVFSVSSVIM